MKKNIQEYLTYITPKFVFIPFDDINLLKIKRNKIVFNNMLLGKLNNGDNIYSSVSGNIIGIKEMRSLSGKHNSLVIENDFIDKKEKINCIKGRNSINKMKKTDLNELLTKFNFANKLSNKKELLVNSSYNKKNDLGDMVLNYEEYEYILETIDLLVDKYNFKCAYINIPKEDLYSEISYKKYINAFDNICIINNSKKLKKDNMAILNVSEIYDIYKAISREYYYEDMFITINENNNNIILKIKEYTSLIELLNDLKISINSKSVYINDNIIEDSKSFIITKNVKSVIIK